MSVVQHIRDRAGRFRWMGLLVVWAVFIVMAAVLLVERAGVQYSAGQHKLGMLAANDAVPASSAIFGQKPTCLVITDSDQAGVEDVKEQFDQILLEMKIAHRDVDLALDGADAIPSLTSFDRVILLMPSLDGLGKHLTDIMSWVSAGGSLMLAMPPDNSSYLQVIASKLGIESAGYDYVKAESIVPSEDFMLGGGERYEFSDPFYSSLSVSLRETAHVWAKTGDAGAPLIWSNDCGSGRTVVCKSVSMTRSCAAFTPRRPASWAMPRPIRSLTALCSFWTTFLVPCPRAMVLISSVTTAFPLPIFTPRSGGPICKSSRKNMAFAIPA